MIVTLPFWIALVFSLALVPLVRNISLRLGFVDTPKDDRWHKKPVPKVGGIAIFAAFFIALNLSVFIFPSITVPWALIVGSLITFVIGIIDDLIGTWRFSILKYLILSSLLDGLLVLQMQSICWTIWMDWQVGWQ